MAYQREKPPPSDSITVAVGTCTWGSMEEAIESSRQALRSLYT
jgi:hypothetical protein